MEHKASCLCGQLSLTYSGEINKTSICHCYGCQKRTGSVFGVQTRIEKEKTRIEGDSKKYDFIADSGGHVNFHFCPKCGATVFWEIDSIPESYIAAVGAFSDSILPDPTFSVYEARKHSWVKLPETITEHWD